MKPYSPPKAVVLAKILGINQSELLEIFTIRFGDALCELVKTECGGRPTKRALRQWAKNNTTSPRRQISHAIKVFRYRHGLTQGQLADRLGWKVWQIADIERCKDCYPKKAREIAAVLKDKCFDELLAFYGWLEDTEEFAAATSDPDLLSAHLEPDPQDEWMPYEEFERIMAEIAETDRQLTPA